MTTIAVFGISGVGKSRICAILAARLGLAHAQASDLLKRAKLEESGGAVSSEDLRKGSVFDDQTMLVTSFRTFAAEKSRNILFDGHSLIDNDDTLIGIPLEVIKAISPAAVLFLCDEPQTIAGRRAADFRQATAVPLGCRACGASGKGRRDWEALCSKSADPFLPGLLAR